MTIYRTDTPDCLALVRSAVVCAVAFEAVLVVVYVGLRAVDTEEDLQVVLQAGTFPARTSMQITLALTSKATGMVLGVRLAQLSVVRLTVALSTPSRASRSWFAT